MGGGYMICIRASDAAAQEGATSEQPYLSTPSLISILWLQGWDQPTLRARGVTLHHHPAVDIRARGPLMVAGEYPALATPTSAWGRSQGDVRVRVVRVVRIRVRVRGSHGALVSIRVTVRVCVREAICLYLQGTPST